MFIILACYHYFFLNKSLKSSSEVIVTNIRLNGGRQGYVEILNTGKISVQDICVKIFFTDDKGILRALGVAEDDEFGTDIVLKPGERIGIPVFLLGEVRDEFVPKCFVYAKKSNVSVPDLQINSKFINYLNNPRVIGELENLSNYCLSYVSVIVTFYNSLGEIVEVASCLVEEIEEGEKVIFIVEAQDSNDQEVVKYNLCIGL